MGISVEKKKKHQAKMGTLPFVAIWVMGYIAGWFALVIVDELSGVIVDDLWGYFIFGIILAVPMIGVQTWLMRTQLQLRIKNWFRLGVPVQMFGVFLLWQFQDATYDWRYDYDLSEQIMISIQVAMMFMPVVLLQTVLLWQHIKNAWLWTLAGLISAATFAMPIVDSSGDEIIIIAALLQGVVMAVTMRWLAKQRRDEKVKVMAEVS